MKLEFVDSIHAIGEQAWQALVESDSNPHYPFLQYAFLAALEDSDSCSEESGWQAKHIVVKQGEQMLAALPCYEKHHSYGEYVFDFQWASAYQQNGLNYYPKLVTAIPFTPCEGSRVLISSEVDALQVNEIVRAVIKGLAESGYESWHGLFMNQAQRQLFTEAAEQLAVRSGVQFHWYNRGYENFGHFLEGFSSRKRKAVKKERAKVLEQGFEISVLEGHAASKDDWLRFYHFYQLTYAKRSGHGGYLSQSFFEMISQNMPDNLVLIMAELEGKPIAGALYFKDDDTLYGRYWGCYAEYDFLHFELCYYQGIEYAIKHGLAHIDAGAQGEHKIQRGFEPIHTYSVHYLAHQGFASAVARFCESEAEHTQAYFDACFEALPYKEGFNFSR